MNMEDCLKDKLGTSILKKLGTADGGCINHGYYYETDKQKIFVKCNSRPGADIMFKGEFLALKEMKKTETVKVPEPLVVGVTDPENFIVMEYYEINPLKKYASSLGRDLAEMHMHNIKRLHTQNNYIGGSDSVGVNKFGFDVTTCCGYLPQNNEWCNDWVTYFVSQRIVPQIQMVENDKNCRQVTELWSELQLKIPVFFKNIDIEPSLLHGDLWIGNAGETNENALIFDPASFYGHHEYDLAITSIFGGFDTKFYHAYHSLIPKAQGFEKRQKLYQLFHYLNHWNHFGNMYKDPSLKIMTDLNNCSF